MSRKGMLSITFRTHKQILITLDIAGAALAAKFFLISHLASSFCEIILNSNYYFYEGKWKNKKSLLIFC